MRRYVLRRGLGSGAGCVKIEPSPRFLQRGSDNYGVYAVWLTYGLSPQWAKPDDRGLVEVIRHCWLRQRIGLRMDRANGARIAPLRAKRQRDGGFRRGYINASAGVRKNNLTI